MARFRFVGVSAVLVALVALPSLGASEREMRKLVKQANDLPSNENAKKIELYTKAIEEFAGFFLPWSNRAICYINYGRWDDAISDASRAIELAPEQPHPWGARGRAYAGKREFERAFADLTRALELASDETDRRNLYNERGNAYFSARQYEKAVKDYAQAVQIDPTFAKGWNNLGIAYRAMGKLDDAYINLDRALRIDEKQSRTYVNLARVMVARNDKMMAARDFDEAVKLDPNDAASLIQRGMFRFLDGKLQDASTDFVTALVKQPEAPYGAIWRFISETSLDLKEDARTRLEVYLRQRTQTDFWPIPVIQYFLGQMTAEQMVHEAEREDDPEIRKERSAEAYYFLAVHAQLKGDRARARDYFKHSIEKDVPRVQEYVMARISLEGWKAPEPPPPRPVPTELNVRLR